MHLKGETENCQKLDKSNSTDGQKPVVYDILSVLCKKQLAVRLLLRMYYYN